MTFLENYMLNFWVKSWLRPKRLPVTRATVRHFTPRRAKG